MARLFLWENSNSKFSNPDPGKWEPLRTSHFSLLNWIPNFALFVFNKALDSSGRVKELYSAWFGRVSQTSSHSPSEVSFNWFPLDVAMMIWAQEINGIKQMSRLIRILFIVRTCAIWQQATKIKPLIEDELQQCTKFSHMFWQQAACFLSEITEFWKVVMYSCKSY